MLGKVTQYMVKAEKFILHLAGFLRI